MVLFIRRLSVDVSTCITSTTCTHDDSDSYVSDGETSTYSTNESDDESTSYSEACEGASEAIDQHSTTSSTSVCKQYEPDFNEEQQFQV